MLGEICAFIHNYFESETTHGTFEISENKISLDFIDGTWFRIKGSEVNDGIFRYYEAGIKEDDGVTDAELIDETFEGDVVKMRVPRELVRALPLIIAYQQNRLDMADALDSPYASESFGGYSYSKDTGTDSHGNKNGTWMEKYASFLNQWRKLA